jgi:hypothetical protein
MIGHLRRNTVAYIALFVALGGTSYAAVTLPRNSVGTQQLRKHSVTGAKVKPHSLSTADFKGKLPAGPKGAAGATGAAGPKGDTGPAGLSASAVQDDLAATTVSGTLATALTIKQVTINMTSSGTLVVVDPEVEHLSFANTSSGTVIYDYIALYLDGKPITGGSVACGCSLAPFGAASVGPIPLPEVSVPGVGAGSHTVTIALTGTTNSNYVSAASTRMVVLATG